MQDRHNDNTEMGSPTPNHPLKGLTPAEFMALGGNAVVYVRPIKGDQLAEFLDRSDFENDKIFQMVVSADGSPLLVTDSTESVAEWLSDKNLGVVTVH
jgi:hypothetical protein